MIKRSRLAARCLVAVGAGVTVLLLTAHSPTATPTVDSISIPGISGPFLAADGIALLPPGTADKPHITEARARTVARGYRDGMAGPVRQAVLAMVHLANGSPDTLDWVVDVTPTNGVTSFGGPRGQVHAFHSTPPNSYDLIFVNATTGKFEFGRFH